MAVTMTGNIKYIAIFMTENCYYGHLNIGYYLL